MHLHEGHILLGSKRMVDGTRIEKKTLSFRFVPESAHAAGSWHNSGASFVSCAESDMVHHDLSPDKMCQCHTLPFVAQVYLKGAQSFWRPQ